LKSNDNSRRGGAPLEMGPPGCSINVTFAVAAGDFLGTFTLGMPNPPRATVEEKMRRTMQLIKGLGRDEDGAALVEYTVLLGIMLVAVITTIGLVGGWMNTKWTALWSALSTN
jgi:pilus assembly protein Flp/PilA